MFRCTVSQGKTEPCWEMTMPLALGPLRGAPSTTTRPVSGRSNPAMMFINVDLPQPEGPTIATNSPSSTLKSMPPMTCRGPWSVAKLLVMLSTAILTGIAPPHGPQPFQAPHPPVEHQPDDADDRHPRDHEVIAIAGVA